MTKNLILIFVIVGLSFMACDKTSTKNVNNGLRVELTDSLIMDLLDRLDTDPDSTLSLHISPTYLNDSSVILTIAQNQFKAEMKSDLQRQLKHKNLDVFIHNSLDDRAFWILHSPTQKILIQWKNGSKYFDSLRPLENYDTTTSIQGNEFILN